MYSVVRTASVLSGIIFVTGILLAQQPKTEVPLTEEITVPEEQPRTDPKPPKASKPEVLKFEPTLPIDATIPEPYFTSKHGSQSLLEEALERVGQKGHVFYLSAVTSSRPIKKTTGRSSQRQVGNYRIVSPYGFTEAHRKRIMQEFASLVVRRVKAMEYEPTFRRTEAGSLNLTYEGKITEGEIWWFSCLAENGVIQIFEHSNEE
tara:strand:+ start:15508 stop:16122 length:615 start_codon:yes stop_codon:yes gene_type:complete